MPDGALMTSALRTHPCAEIFPLMEGAAFDALVADIKANGLREPIVVLKGKILDGRNRYRAAKLAEVPIEAVEFEGDDPVSFVWSANFHRRHLDESQKAMAAVRRANLKVGQPKKNSATLPNISQAEAATRAGISTRTVTSAAAVLKDGIPELVKRVEAGEVTVNVAAQIAKMPEEKQRAVINDTPAQLSGAAKKYKRAEREQEFAQATKDAAGKLGQKTYGVIYADPPWKFEPYSTDTGMDRAADNHYETMQLEDIKTMAVPAADHCVLFLWATVPMLPEALDVMKAWGFVYKSHCVWVKDRIGTGFWFRNKHELLLVGTRGNKVPAPAHGNQYASVIDAALGEHSKKPACFAEMIEELFPNVPAVELFARGERLGWDVWGNEAGKKAT